MSPRAAWRLDRLGFASVFDYAAGKVDWLAAGLPSVRANPSQQRSLDALEPNPLTCAPDDSLPDIVAAPGRSLIVLNPQRIVLGRVPPARRGESATAETQMEPGPATVRAHEPLQPLLDDLRHDLAPVLDHIPTGEQLTVGAYDLRDVHGCESRWQHRKKWSGWTVDMVRGQVAHAVVGRLVMDPEPGSPLDLADQVLDRLAHDDGKPERRDFIANLDTWDRHELVTFVADVATKYVGDFPPIERKWRPRVESSLWFPVFGQEDERIKLHVKCDLIIGTPVGNRAKTLVIDLKSGNRRSTDIDQVRYYALVETLIRRVPPFRVAVYYLDGGEAWVEDVNEQLLETAARRLVDGATAMAEIRYGDREGSTRPGPLCAFCDHRDECSVGSDYLAERTRIA